MKKLYFLISLIALLFTANCDAATVTIDQTNNTFVPSAITTVMVGDIIHFVWSSGTHTTTSLSVPVGAEAWDEPLDMDNTSYDYTVVVEGIYAYHCDFHTLMAGGFQANATSIVEANINSAADFTAGVDFNSHTLHVNIDNYYPSDAILRLIDITGKEVAILFDQPLGMGQQQFHFEMSGRNAGIYFLRLEQNGKVVTRRVLIN